MHKLQAIAKWNTIDAAAIDRIITMWLESPHEETPEMYNLVKFTVDKDKLKRSVRRIFHTKHPNENILQHIRTRKGCSIRSDSEHMTEVEKLHLLLHSTIDTTMNLTFVLTVTHYYLETSDRVPLYALILQSMVNCNIFRLFEIYFTCNAQFPFATCALNKTDKDLLALMNHESLKHIVIYYVLHAADVANQGPTKDTAPIFEGFKFGYIHHWRAQDDSKNSTILYDNTTT